MIIRKKFRVESAHIVRNCTSHRCSHSIHGHSAVIELFLESDKLDNAQMVYDFGLLKGSVKEFIDSMDHCYLLCANDKPEFKEFITKNCNRWIELPFNPSAEMLSMFVFDNVQKILDNTIMKNGEQNVHVKSVRYHETTTGYAEASNDDVKNIYRPITATKPIIYSAGVVSDWSPVLRGVLFDDIQVINPEIEQQIKL